MLQKVYYPAKVVLGILFCGGSKIIKNVKPIEKFFINYAKDNPELLKKFRKNSKESLKRISNIYKDSKKDGGRMGLKFGSGTKRKTNVEKIKETFSPKKKLSEKQMKIAKLAGDRKRIDAKDLAKLRGRG